MRPDIVSPELSLYYLTLINGHAAHCGLLEFYVLTPSNHKYKPYAFNILSPITLQVEFSWHQNKTCTHTFPLDFEFRRARLRRRERIHVLRVSHRGRSAARLPRRVMSGRRGGGGTRRLILVVGYSNDFSHSALDARCSLFHFGCSLSFKTL